MTTSSELRRLETQFLEAETALRAATVALNRARAENRLPPVSSLASADAAWSRMIGEAERKVKADDDSRSDFANLVLDSSRFRRGEVVSVAEARRQRLMRDNK
jgi:hypothetical protein